MTSTHIRNLYLSATDRPHTIEFEILFPSYASILLVESDITSDSDISSHISDITRYSDITS